MFLGVTFYRWAWDGVVRDSTLVNVRYGQIRHTVCLLEYMSFLIRFGRHRDEVGGEKGEIRQHQPLISYHGALFSSLCNCARLLTFLNGRTARSVISSSNSARLKQNEQATQDLVEHPIALRTMQSTAPIKDESENLVAAVDEPIQVSEASDQRDVGVTDAV